MTVTEKLKLRLKAALRTRREFDEFLDILFSSFSGGGGNCTVAAPVVSVNGQTGAVVLDAADIAYDNSGSSLLADDTQEAIDELANMIATLPDPITYKGSYNATTNTPTLSDSDTNVEGFLYRVTVAGTQNFGSGPISFEVGELLIVYTEQNFV